MKNSSLRKMFSIHDITARVWMQLYIHDYIRYVEKNVEYPSERIRDIDRYIDRQLKAINSFFFLFFFCIYPFVRTHVWNANIEEVGQIVRSLSSTVLESASKGNYLISTNQNMVQGANRLLSAKLLRLKFLTLILT